MSFTLLFSRLLVLPSHAGSLLGGHSWRGLAGQGVHGPQELVGDAAGLAQAAQQRAVHRGRVVADGVLTREEQPRDGLGGENKQRLLVGLAQSAANNTLRVLKVL